MKMNEKQEKLAYLSLQQLRNAQTSFTHLTSSLMQLGTRFDSVTALEIDTKFRELSATLGNFRNELLKD